SRRPTRSHGLRERGSTRDSHLLRVHEGCSDRPDDLPYPYRYLTPNPPRGLFHLTDPGVHMISHVPHSTQSSYWNCITPFASEKQPAGHPYMHIKWGQVLQIDWSIVMCAYSALSKLYVVAPRSALISIGS